MFAQIFSEFYFCVGYLTIILCEYSSCLQWVMDSDDLKVADGHEVAHQNGVRKQFVASGVADDVNQTITVIARPNGDSESVDKLDESGTTGEVREGESDNVESNGLVVAKV